MAAKHKRGCLVSQIQPPAYQTHKPTCRRHHHAPLPPRSRSGRKEGAAGIRLYRNLLRIRYWLGILNKPVLDRSAALVSLWLCTQVQCSQFLRYIYINLCVKTCRKKYRLFLESLRKAMQVVAAVLLLLFVVALVTRWVSATSGPQRTSTGATNFGHLTPAAIAAT